MNNPQQHTEKPTRHSLAPVIGVTSVLALSGVALAIAAYVRQYVLHDLPMTAALSGELYEYRSRAGRLAYYVNGSYKRSGAMSIGHAQPPILFIHSVNAAASSYEQKPLYEHYARSRKVYSLELPGFGFSERGHRAYSPALYRDVINEFIEHELKGIAVDAVALSLGCEFLALAAIDKPEHFRTLTLLSPTGMGPGLKRSTGNDALLKFLLAPKWSRMLYDLITSRPSIRYFVSMTQARPPSHGFLHHAYVTSHQPDAQYAPYYFLSGKLFTPGIFTQYQELKQPVLMVYGQSKIIRFDRVDLLRAKPNWSIVRFEQCGDLVHFDNTQGVVSLIDKLHAGT
jgi:pimeloyl-ACP methyl ester carboxylesterase